MIKKLLIPICALLSVQIHAMEPLTLSDPVPSISSVMYVGDAAYGYTYTLINNTNKNIPVTQSVTGNDPNITVSSSCATVPARGRCSFTVTALPTGFGYLLGSVTNTVRVDYDGRLP